MSLTIDTIGRLKLRNKVVTVPQLGEVRIRVLSGSERLALAQAAMRKPEDGMGIVRQMLQCAVIDDNGKQVFENGTIDKLFECDGEGVQRLIEIVQEYVGFACDAVERAKKN